MPSEQSVFLTDDAIAEFKDCFIDSNSAPEKFVFEQIRAMAREAKRAKITKKITYNNLVDGIPSQKTVKFSEAKLEEYAPASDPNWRPEGDDIVPLTIKVGDKSTELLKLYAEMYCFRTKKFNESIPIKDPLRKTKTATVPSCFEEIVHNGIIDAVIKEINKNIDKDLNEEFEEIYGEKKKEKPKPPDGTGGVRPDPKEKEN